MLKDSVPGFACEGMMAFLGTESNLTNNYKFKNTLNGCHG